LLINRSQRFYQGPKLLGSPSVHAPTSSGFQRVGIVLREWSPVLKEGLVFCA